MFWGLILKANKKYTQTVQKDFHLSAAALDLSKSGDNDVQVMLTSEEHTYLLCTLGRKCPQVSLDLNFKQGEQVSLSTKGEGMVHLTGYLIPDDEELFGGLGDEEEEEEDEELEVESPVKGKGGKQDRIAKKVAQKVNAKEVQQQADDDDDDDMDESFQLPKDAKKQLSKDGDDSDDNSDDDDEDDDSEDDDDADVTAGTLDGEGASDDDDDSEDDDDDDDDDDDEDDSDDDEDEQPKAKVAKLDKKPSKQNGLENGKASSKELKKEDKSPQHQQKDEPKMRTLQGGLVVEDLKVGGGPEAKPGKKIAVYYEGRLKKNNKVFDSTAKGPGFKFALGRGEVIKGWDLGVTGMKVGGKRRLTVPHQLAYGTRGSPPTIPPNSTLVFDVELKNVF